MKILWCHEVSYLDKPVYEYQEFAEHLVACGHSVEVMDFQEGEATTLETRAVSKTGVADVMLSTIPHSGFPLLKYAEARLRYRKALLQRLRSNAYDVAFVYSVFINGTQTVDLCQRFGIPVAYRVLDAYHRLRPGRLGQAILMAGEKKIYRNADAILTTNEEMSTYVEELADMALGDRLSVVDHGVDGNHFKPRNPDQDLAKKFGIAPEDVVAVFLGTTYGFSGLPAVIERLSRLKQTHSRLKLMIVGAGELDGQLAALVKTTGLEGDVLLAGMIPYNEVPRYLSLARIALNPFEINEITRDIVPIKILQYQAMGLPVVSTPLPDLVRKHPTSNSGVIYSNDDTADAFAETLNTALSSHELELIGDRGRRYMENAFTLDSALKKVEYTLQKLIKVAKEKARA